MSLLFRMNGKLCYLKYKSRRGYIEDLLLVFGALWLCNQNLANVAKSCLLRAIHENLKIICIRSQICNPVWNVRSGRTLTLI